MPVGDDVWFTQVFSIQQVICVKAEHSKNDTEQRGGADEGLFFFFFLTISGKPVRKEEASELELKGKIRKC